MCTKGFVSGYIYILFLRLGKCIILYNISIVSGEKKNYTSS